MPLLPFVKEAWGKKLEQVISHFIIADQETLGPSLCSRIHPVPATGRLVAYRNQNRKYRWFCVTPPASTTGLAAQVAKSTGGID